MRTYIAEPLPTQLDPLIAEYLGRQFQAIQTAFMSRLVVPEALVMPSEAAFGEMVLLTERDDSAKADPGLYLYFKDDNGDPAWMQVQTTLDWQT